MAAPPSQPPTKRRKIAEVSLVILVFVEDSKAHKVPTPLLLQWKKDVDSAFEVAATTITEKLWRPRASFTYQSLHRVVGHARVPDHQCKDNWMKEDPLTLEAGGTTVALSKENFDVVNENLKAKKACYSGLGNLGWLHNDL